MPLKQDPALGKDNGDLSQLDNTIISFAYQIPIIMNFVNFGTFLNLMKYYDSVIMVVIFFKRNAR